MFGVTRATPWSLADLPIVNENIAKEAHVMTDDGATYYKKLGDFAGHDAVNHSAEEYVRHEDGKPVISTNTIEGYFSIFKRGMKGVYQHCSDGKPMRRNYRDVAHGAFPHTVWTAVALTAATMSSAFAFERKSKRLT